MTPLEQVQVRRIRNDADRAAAMVVLKATYLTEKHWVANVEKVFEPADLQNEHVSWFVAFRKGEPVGVLRILYQPPLELYKAYGFKIVVKGLDLDAFIRDNRIAEIGRFAVLPEQRRFPFVAGALMRTASEETVRRGFTHYVTDIFEGEKHSPYDFHTRVMGFLPVATHDTGELNCPNRRITLILDLKQAYHRLKSSKKWVFRLLTENWDDELHRKMEEGAKDLQTA